MASTTMMQTGLSSRQAFTSASSRQARRQPRTAVCASKDAQEHTTKDFVMKTVGALTAAQLALLPLTGAALARDVGPKGDLAVQGATKAGAAAQEAVPKGARDPNTREQRNSSRDQGIADKLSVVKRRVDADNILNDPEIESGGRQNIFVPSTLFADPRTPSKGVSYSGDVAAAPSLQVNVDFERAAGKGLLRTVGNPVSERDLGRRQPTDDPLAPAQDKLPVESPSSPGDLADKAQQAAGKVADKVQGAPAGGGSAGTDSLGDNIKRAAITSNSPAGQIAKNLGQKDVAFTPAANVVFQTAAGLNREASDMDNASFQGPEGNEGGVTQPTNRRDLNLSGNPKRGGDLKDSTTDFAAQNKGGRDEGTPGQTDASARPGANTPKGQNELQNPNTPTLPNALGGKNFVRNDSETPEDTAAGNIAKAQQSSGNAIDSIKKGLGL